MSIDSHQFTKFGIAASAVLTFGEEWDSDTMQVLGDIAHELGIPTDLAKIEELRDAAEQHDIDLSTYGDEVPSLMFSGRIGTHVAARVERARRDWHDMRMAAAREHSDVDETDTADAMAEYVEALEAYAGITVK